MRMLLDHKAEIGYWTIDGIIVLACEKSEDVGEPVKARTIFIVLSDRRYKDYRSLPARSHNHNQERRCIEEELRGVCHSLFYLRGD